MFSRVFPRQLVCLKLQARVMLTAVALSVSHSQYLLSLFVILFDTDTKGKRFAKHNLRNAHVKRSS